MSEIKGPVSLPSDANAKCEFINCGTEGKAIDASDVIRFTYTDKNGKKVTEDKTVKQFVDAGGDLAFVRGLAESKQAAGRAPSLPISRSLQSYVDRLKPKA